MSTTAYLVVAVLLFLTGMAGFMVRRNLIVMFMALEIMINAAGLAFVALADHFQAMDAQVWVFFVIALAAAESAVGLALLIAIFRLRRSVDVDELAGLRG